MCADFGCDIHESFGSAGSIGGSLIDLGGEKTPSVGSSECYFTSIARGPHVRTIHIHLGLRDHIFFFSRRYPQNGVQDDWGYGFHRDFEATLNAFVTLGGCCWFRQEDGVCPERLLRD